jgi:4-hydroxybutyrate dehydrogenase/sulfolactaldehyde 3-reductase
MTKNDIHVSGERYGSYAFIGLGQMGSPMASNLLKQGHQLSVFDVNPMPFSAWWKKGHNLPAARLRQQKAQNLSSPCCQTAIWCAAYCSVSRRLRKPVPQALVIDMSTIHPLQTDKLIAT